MITEIKSNSVEEWAKEFSKFDPTKLSEYESDFLISIGLNKVKIDSISIKELEGDSEVIKFINRMASSYPFKLSNSSILFLSILVNSPGEIRMILSYLQYKLHEVNFTKGDIVNIDLLYEFFPVGFPSREWFSKMWLNQKYDGMPDNMLDYVKSYESIKLY